MNQNLFSTSYATWIIIIRGCDGVLTLIFILLTSLSKMRIRILGAVAFVGLLAQFEAESPLKIMTCVPDTLGSESFRAHQTWSYSAGLLKQPASSSIDCLTVSGDVLSGQGSLLFEMLPCNSTNAQNQTWELLGTGQIALSNGAGIMTPGRCADSAVSCASTPTHTHAYT